MMNSRPCGSGQQIDGNASRTGAIHLLGSKPLLARHWLGSQSFIGRGRSLGKTDIRDSTRRSLGRTGARRSLGKASGPGARCSGTMMHACMGRE